MSPSRERRTVHACSARIPKRNGFNPMLLRPAVLGLAKLAFLPLVSAAPLLGRRSATVLEADDELPKDSPDIWAYLGVAIALVLLGGAFAGLTIALMGQDETYLQVIATSGDGKERKNAAKVLRLLQRGKHWVLVTLLLSNVITNETLPIVLDRSLGGGWPAVVSSTVLIVIFGEIAPQSVCVRFGLSIGAFMAPYVLALMWIMAPVAWPTAKLLDWALGEDHGTSYSKPGLKTLVQLHKTLGSAADRLLEDEVKIISSVLDLKEKAVGDIMTPMQDVFTMSAETVLDEKMMDIILSQGYSRIPIYAPDNSRNFIGMLLVKILITYDPEDCKRVRDFALATLPETGPYTSCLDIINFFQEGKSHMVLVSDYPGQDKGATGVVTLEDVIEELIGEEIIDESDVFVDVHKAIRRMAPAPRTKYSKLLAAAESEVDIDKAAEDTPLLARENGEVTSRKPSLINGQSTTFLMRRKSSNASDSTRDTVKPVPVRSNTSDLRKQLQHLGPSNMASKPRSTKYTSVKIKPGVGTIPEGQTTTTGVNNGSDRPRAVSVSERPADLEAGEGAGLLKDAGQDASGGVNALQAGYGTIHSPTRSRSRRRSTGQESINETGKPDSVKMSPAMASQQAQMNVTTPPAGESRENGGTEYTNNGRSDSQDASGRSPEATRSSGTPLKVITSASPPQTKSGATTPTEKLSRSPEDKNRLSPGASRKYGDKLVVGPHHDADAPPADDNDTVGEMEAPSRDRSKNRRTARSGSITETTVDINGMKKVVLETTSSSDDENNSPSSPKKNAAGLDGSGDVKDEDGKSQIVIKGENNAGEGSGTGSGNGTPTGSGGGSAADKKKKKKKSKKKGKKEGGA